MSLKVRKELSVLKNKVKEHCAANPLFSTDFLEWIEAQKDVFTERLIAENNENTRGMIQMLDGMKKDFNIG
jgi:hypothetical protein